MGVKTYRDKNGELMVKGAPAGAWVLWVLAVLIMIINIPITLTNPVVGIIVFIIMSLFFYAGRHYCKAVQGKVARAAMEAEQKESNNRFTN